MSDVELPSGDSDEAMLGVGAVGWEQASRLAEDYVRREGLRAPLGADPLRQHAERLVAEVPALAGSSKPVAILLHNAVWLPKVRVVPVSRRLLLLPQCLRDVQHCKAEQDAAGLLCARCGHCVIGGLVELAESLGMVSLVAEGATLVRQLIATGRIEAVVGVGCLASLEKLFPEMLTFGVPGLAVPLRRSGCSGTQVDAAWVQRLLEIGEESQADVDVRLAEEGLIETVRSWFAAEALEAYWGGGPFRDVEILALKVLEQGGKRWRPFLTVSIWEAIQGEGTPLPESLHTLALAVECFHKASLVHDDIEDGDSERYGHPTLHTSHGLAVALNVGDFLVGEGYRLLSRAAADCDGATARAMFAVAAEGHRTLSVGQGDELAWTVKPRRIGVGQILGMMADKTAPAFDVALRLGALMAGSEDEECEALAVFSRAFGLAYQMQDDLFDFRSGEDLWIWRPNLVVAMLCDSDDAEAGEAVESMLQHAVAGHRLDAARLQLVAKNCGALDQAEALCRDQLKSVEATLDAFRRPNVASWLHGVVARVLVQ